VLKLKNKKGVVTGGSRGIGRAIVKELALRSCSHVLLTDISFTQTPEDCAKEIENEIGNSAKILAFKADATSFSDAQATLQEAIDKMGGVDFLVNNAGITKDNLIIRMNENDFDAVINVNLKSVFNYTKAALKHMIPARFGRIVNIASVVGLIGNAGQSNYAASKAGLIGFSKSIAREVASRNITVNCVAPGFIETDMTKKLNESQREALMKNVPLSRMGTPEDIAKVVNFLCSEDADYITGQVITVDGGMVM
jgi:3-oxoacyl-[acyl-carrier protein] reductase